MQLLDRIRAAFMSAQVVSQAELSQRLADAEVNLANARDELEAEEQIAAATGVGGPVDELSLARIDKKLAEKRARVARWEEQVRRLQTALRVAGERELAEKQASVIAAVDATLSQRQELAKEIDAWAAQGGKLLQRHHALKEGVFTLTEALSLARPLDWPATFTGYLPRLVQIRLFSFAGSLVLPPGNVSAWDAQSMPSLAKRAADERVHLLSQLRATPRSEPPEAA